jgi:2-haloacid dehalogenase
VRLLALTNWSAESFRIARKEFAFLDLFESIVVSGEERVAKPDPRIFALLLERHGLEPGRTMFVDDAAANVASAQAAGMVAVQFSDAASLRRRLVGEGLLPATPAAPGSVSL